MKQVLRRIIPKVIKNFIRSSVLYERRRVKQLASFSKRIDICSAQFSHGLHLSHHAPLSGKVCLEIGCGWVLSHAIVCHLLGAKKVIVTDIIPHAQPEVLYEALHDSVISVIRDVLSPFEEHSLIRKRLDNLLSIRYFDFNTLKGLGIEYVAPIDFANDRLNIPVDFVFSNSVLEHVPCEDVPLVLANITADLSPGGTMIHFIHLEDHHDISGEPFGFLSIPSDDYSRSLQSSRGNRIRESGWKKYFDALDNADSKFIYQWVRKDRELPRQIDPSILYNDEVDLRTSHIGVYTRKKAS